jgi:cytochrome c oxidase subunit 2
MNPQIADAVASVDRTFLFIFGVSVVILLGVTAAMVWFVYRYSRKRNPIPADFDGNLTAEILWTVLPTLLVLGMFFSGWSSYRALRDVPEGAMEVKVTARMWSWGFEYATGKKSNVLWAPVGEPVKLSMVSTDVIHGFAAPAFRIKQDVVPGMTTYAWFKADEPGDYDVFCTVYCGLQHAKMLTTIKAVPRAEFDAWLAAGAVAAGGPGKDLLDAKGCLGCHSLDGAPGAGPTLQGIFGHTVTVITPDGQEYTTKIDRTYLRDSILGPDPGVVKGFEPIMPEYAGQLTPEEVEQMLDFLEKGEASLPDGREVADQQGCLGCHSTDGTIVAGPSFRGMMGRTTRLDHGGVAHEMAVDRQYVLDQLAKPEDFRVQGFDPIMPAYPGLTEPEKEALLRWLESLSGKPAGSSETGLTGMSGESAMPGGRGMSGEHGGHATP